MHIITVTLKEQGATITLVNKKGCNVAQKKIESVRDSANQLLGTIEMICSENDMGRDDIKKVVLTSSLSDSAITQRAVRTISRVLCLRNS